MTKSLRSPTVSPHWRRMRAAVGSGVTLVALTGWGQDEDKRRSREAGFDHHLTKPPEPDTIDRLIGVCLAGDRPHAPPA